MKYLKPTVITYDKNTSVRQIIGAIKIRGSQKYMKVQQKVTKGDCSPYNASQCLSC